MSEQPLFHVEHRGFAAEAFHADGPNARIVVTRDGAPYREFRYPAYRVYNIAAHFSDMVDAALAEEGEAAREGDSAC